MSHPAITLYDEIKNHSRRPIAAGILNLTKDSFYDGGLYLEEQAINHQIRKMIQEGASIIDLGGCSTRPGASPVSVEEELDRIMMAMRLLRAINQDIPVSIDTFRAEVVEEVVSRFGTLWVNDISGGAFDSRLLDVIAHYQLPYVLMHIQGRPENMQLNPQYESIITELQEYFSLRLMKLKELNIHRILIDPGFGFGKDLNHNYIILNELGKLAVNSYPIYVGLSRKSMIYKLLNLTPNDSLNATTALHMLALQQGAKVLRVHDVAPAIECIRLHEFMSTCID
jgi:dihydropteroate synthase